MKRIEGLDSLRFVCAFVVMLGHINLPVPEVLSSTNLHGLPLLARGIFRCAVNGPAAVIIFFIISGFCIHYPFRNSNSIQVVPFLVRRLVRILIPALIAFCLFISVGDPPKYPIFGVFWSIICEVIYYILYPILFALRRKIKWEQLIVITYIFTLIIVTFHLKEIAEDPGYASLGLITFLIGLPVWIMGCWLADNYSRFPTLTSIQIWGVRCLIWGFTIILMVLKFHTHSVFSSSTISLNIFAFFACFWVGLEINYFKKHKPLFILEWSGQWSYSLYIIHPIALLILYAFGINTIEYFLIKVVAIFIVSYLFFLAIEKPSHKLAIYLSKKTKLNEFSFKRTVAP